MSRAALVAGCWVLGVGGSVFGAGRLAAGARVESDRSVRSVRSTLAPTAEHPTPPAERLGDHRYRIGHVIVDTARKIIQVPCRVNMHRGMIEFLAVASEGKLHESVLLAEAEPLHVHLALLLLGLEPGHGARYHGDLETPSGPGVEARVEWRVPAPATRRGSMAAPPLAPAAAPLRRARLEEFAWDIPARRPMPPVAWLFTGAMPPGPGPRLEEERSLVATYRDPGAVLTNPLPTGDDDSVYKANERLVPPVGTPVTLLLSPVEQHESPAGAGARGTETRSFGVLQEWTG